MHSYLNYQYRRHLKKITFISMHIYAWFLLYGLSRTVRNANTLVVNYKFIVDFHKCIYFIITRIMLLFPNFSFYPIIECPKLKRLCCYFASVWLSSKRNWHGRCSLSKQYFKTSIRLVIFRICDKLHYTLNVAVRGGCAIKVAYNSGMFDNSHLLIIYNYAIHFLERFV